MSREDSTTATTHMYIEADLAMKQRALISIQAPHFKQHRFCPPKDILAFLDGLWLCLLGGSPSLTVQHERIALLKLLKRDVRPQGGRTHD